MNDDIPMDIPPIAAPKAPVAYAEAVKPAPAKKSAPVAEDPVVGDPIAKDVVEDADDLPFEDPAPTPPPPAKKAAPAKTAKPAPAPKTETSEDINAKIDDILAGMAL